jgi:hypothetical protein
MASVIFRDKAGQEHSIDVAFTIGTRRALTSKIGSKAVSQVMLDDMTDDLAIDCFYECCRKGLEAVGITREEFEDQIDGGQLAALEAAFLEAVLNFTKPAERDERRQVLNESRAKLQAAKSALTKNALAVLDQELAKITMNSPTLLSTRDTADTTPIT